MPHVQVQDIPEHLPRTREAVLLASNEQLDDLMGICPDEPADPDSCLACLAYMTLQDRVDATRRSQASTSPRAVVFLDIEAHRHKTEEPALEAELSINDWIRRIQTATMPTQQAARQGAVDAEYDLWIEIASIAAARAEVLANIRNS